MAFKTLNDLAPVPSQHYHLLFSPWLCSGLLASLLFPRLTNTLPLRTFHLLFRFSGIFLLPSTPMACSLSSLWSLLTRQSPGETWLALAAFKLQLSEFSWGTVCLLYCTEHHQNTKYFSFLLCPSPKSKVSAMRQEFCLFYLNLFKWHWSIIFYLTSFLILKYSGKSWHFHAFFFLFSNLSLIFSCVQWTIIF